MKKSILLFCVFMLPLTLASDTQHRFKVYVYVNGDDDQAVNTIESRLKRELRLLGDVDVVGEDDDWEYIIEIVVMAIQWKDGTKTGKFAIATYRATRLSKFAYNRHEDYDLFQSTFGGALGAVYSPREALHEFCINYVNSFDKDKLVYPRSLYKR